MSHTVPYPIMNQHETVAIDRAVGELKTGLLDETRKERDAGAEQHRVDLQDDLVDLREERRGQVGPAAEPDAQARLPPSGAGRCVTASSEADCTSRSGLAAMVRETRNCLRWG